MLIDFFEDFLLRTEFCFDKEIRVVYLSELRIIELKQRRETMFCFRKKS